MIMVAVVAELQTDKSTNVDWHKKFKISVVSSHMFPSIVCVLFICIKRNGPVHQWLFHHWCAKVIDTVQHTYFHLFVSISKITQYVEVTQQQLLQMWKKKFIRLKSIWKIALLLYLFFTFHKLITSTWGTCVKTATFSLSFHFVIYPLVWRLACKQLHLRHGFSVHHHIF